MPALMDQAGIDPASREVDAIARDSSISVVVIAGNGPRSRAVTI